MEAYLKPMLEIIYRITNDNTTKGDTYGKKEIVNS